MWLFASHRSKGSFARIQGGPDKQSETKYLVLCSVCGFPAKTIHFVLSVALDNEWNCPLSHNTNYKGKEEGEIEKGRSTVATMREFV